MACIHVPELAASVRFLSHKLKISASRSINCFSISDHPSISARASANNWQIMLMSGSSDCNNATNSSWRGKLTPRNILATTFQSASGSTYSRRGQCRPDFILATATSGSKSAAYLWINVVTSQLLIFDHFAHQGNYTLPFKQTNITSVYLNPFSEVFMVPAMSIVCSHFCKCRQATLQPTRLPS